MNTEKYNRAKLHKIYFILISFIVVTIFLIWYLERKSETTLLSESEVINTKIRIATSKNLWCTLTLVALDRGFFQSEGLEPEVKIQAAGRLNMDALLGGAVDFANVVETNIAYQALNNTKDLLIHGRIVSATDYAILTKKSSNIVSEKDINGKRISYAQATGSESFLFWFIEKENINVSNIKLVPLQPAGLVDNFLGGNTDAVVTWEPFVTTIQERDKELGPLFRADSNGFKGIMTIATRQTWAMSNPNLIEAYIRVMKRSAQFVKDSVDVSQKVISEQTGLPLTTIISAWKRFDFSYVNSLEKEKILVGEVVRRIKMIIPEMVQKEPENINNYFQYPN